MTRLKEKKFCSYDRNFSSLSLSPFSTNKSYPHLIRKLVIPTDFVFTGADYIKSLNLLNICPLQVARWCVTSLPEKMKCEDLMMSLKAKNIFPELDCILAESAIGCMELISEGVADLVTLDAGDVYTAGRYADDSN